ncbi:sphingomyelin phosphodiesterase 3 [Periophthalmus magnuspinnatus]|uniref:sphingomyelin phosphodiesterase 3 n=1 Tax=Periophthalmus magnuspinnatus TaxID=409849 RepID=UPI002436CFF1|nr:sphingomyelin phosphodiesterase 3 [Periophthalmus magnuspinnatus]
MVLYSTPYPSACLHFLDGLSWSLVFPCYWLLDRLLASCVATSLEKRQRSRDPCSFLSLCVLVWAPLYLLLLLLSLPLALVGFILWAPLQAVRQPYLYTYIKLDRSLAEQGQAGSGGLSEWRPQGRSFCFCSANVCLLPDSLARFNNLSDTHRRAREVGKRIRNGANRPQIKIYIDSPTNTSISAASFSSLATGFRRTSSLDQRPEQSHSTSGPADSETEPLTGCPLHSSAASDCPAHPTVEQGSSPCPLHQDGVESTPVCPLHSSSDCPVHNGGSAPDCPLHQSSGGQNNSPEHHTCPMHPSKGGDHNCPMHSSAGVEHTCPIHSASGADPNCSMHSPGGGDHKCPMHSPAGGDHNCSMHSPAGGDHNCPMHSPAGGDHNCPMHSPAGGDHKCPMQSPAGGDHNCPMHGEGTPSKSCPLHSSGVQISISAPEPQEEDQPDPPVDTASMTASRESLTRYHGDGGGGMYSNNTLSHVPRTSIFKRAARKRRHGDETFDHEISAFFPANLDFLALQEVFDHGATTRLRHQLHRYFPYVLSDVGQYGWKSCCSRFKFLNSGLMLASRYPILDARYECYPNGRGEDALAAKGALFAKVHVGTSHQEQRIVGYLTCTHLHAIEGDAAVRCEQLDLLLQWGAEFRQASSQPSEGEKVLEDLVAFDVVLGDLNFDNCSSEDKLEQQHALFTQYKDPCRLGPGEDKPWALGTLLDPSGLYDDEVSSPESLQKVMENEEGRKEYLVFPPSKSQCPRSSQKGRKIPLKGNGRRIDYILYSDEGLQPDWKLDLEEFSFVTQLAGLTDHLSVAMRLAVSTGEDEP